MQPYSALTEVEMQHKCN